MNEQADVARHLPDWIDQIVRPVVPPQPFRPRGPRPDLRVDLVRPDDLLCLHIDGYNLHVVWVHDKAFLDRIDAAKDAYFVVTFPPQNIAEGAYYNRVRDDKDSTPSDADDPLKLPPAAAGQAKPPPDTQPDGQLVDPGRVPARLAGPSRLAFRIESGSAMPEIPYTMAGLLDWSGFELVVPALADIGPTPTPAQIAQAPEIAPPGPIETALELPYRLILSPQSRVRWVHAMTPVQHGNGRVELWHTRLALPPGRIPGPGVRPDHAELWETADPAYLRAVWSPDFDPVPSKTAVDPALGVTDISPNDRYQIVILTSAFHGWAKGLRPPEATASEPPFVPSPVEARLLMLSSLGGWLRSRGTWEPPHSHRLLWPGLTSLSDLVVQRPRELAVRQQRALPVGAALEQVALQPAAAGIGATPLRRGIWVDGQQLDLSEWVHVAAQGRDHYVKIVYEGFLYPFGHRAALIKVTERKFIDVTLADGQQTPVAYLIQRQYIVVRQPEKVYPGHAYSFGGFEMPIKKIRVTTLVTPDLALPREILGGTAFSSWIVIDQNSPHDFKFHIVATDLEGNEAEFTTSLIFYSFWDFPTSLGPIQAAYRTSGERRACVVRGQKVSYAPRDAASPGTDNTTIPTEALYFDTQAYAAEIDTFGGFVPFLFKANVRLHAVEQLLGTDAPTTIRLYGGYLNNRGVDAHAGVFAEIVKDTGGTLSAAPLPMTFSPKQGGGVATPNMNLSSLTRRHGPTAGTPANAAADAFAPGDFFGGMPADLLPKLFGSIKLTDIIPNGSAAKNAPKVVTTTSNTIGGGKAVTVAFDWIPDLAPLSSPLVSFTPSLSGHGNAALTIHADMIKEIKADGTPAGEGTSHLKGTLTYFTITLLSSVALNVVLFEFTSDTGSKPKVDVRLDDTNPFEFTGDLTFVQDLKDLIPAGALGDGPSLDVLPTGVHVGFAISLPPASLGVFTLENIKFGAGLTLPFFSGSPVLDLAFAERAHPFILTVSLFGGGGFFHLQLDTGGIKMLEAAFEFGAAISINLGVASGGVHVMAGVYFCLQDDPDNPGRNKTTLTGFFRVGGEVSVLGIVSISIEFELSFSYLSVGKAAGQATVSISVHVAFFSKSFSVTVEKQFGGSGSDPRFAQLITTPAIWQEYANAFA